MQLSCTFICYRNDKLLNDVKQAWDSDEDVYSNKYVRTKPDIYSSAGKHFSKDTYSDKPSVFDRLGPAVPGISTPLLSDADLESLHTGEHLLLTKSMKDEKKKQETEIELKLGKVTPVLAPIPSSKPKHPRIESNKEDKQRLNVSGAKMVDKKCEKVTKSDDTHKEQLTIKVPKELVKSDKAQHTLDNFGNILSSIDKKLLEESKTKKKDEKRHAMANGKDDKFKKFPNKGQEDVSRNQCQVKGKEFENNFSPACAANSTPTGAHANEASEGGKPARLSDKYKHKPRTSIEKIQIVPELIQKEVYVDHAKQNIQKDAQINLSKERDPRLRHNNKPNNNLCTNPPQKSIYPPFNLPQITGYNDVLSTTKPDTDFHNVCHNGPLPILQNLQRLELQNMSSQQGTFLTMGMASQVMGNSPNNDIQLPSRNNIPGDLRKPYSNFSPPQSAQFSNYNGYPPAVQKHFGYGTPIINQQVTYNVQNTLTGYQNVNNPATHFDRDRFDYSNNFNAGNRYSPIVNRSFNPYEPLDSGNGDNVKMSFQSHADGMYQQRRNYGGNNTWGRYDQSESEHNRYGKNKYPQEKPMLSNKSDPGKFNHDTNDAHKSGKFTQGKENSNEKYLDKHRQPFVRDKYDEIYTKLDRDKSSYVSPLGDLYSAKDSTKSFKIPKKSVVERKGEQHSNSPEQSGGKQRNKQEMCGTKLHKTFGDCVEKFREAKSSDDKIVKVQSNKKYKIESNKRDVQSLTTDKYDIKNNSSKSQRKNDPTEINKEETETHGRILRRRKSTCDVNDITDGTLSEVSNHSEESNKIIGRKSCRKRAKSMCGFYCENSPKEEFDNNLNLTGANSQSEKKNQLNKQHKTNKSDNNLKEGAVCEAQTKKMGETKASASTSNVLRNSETEMLQNLCDEAKRGNFSKEEIIEFLVNAIQNSDIPTGTKKKNSKRKIISSDDSSDDELLLKRSRNVPNEREDEEKYLKADRAKCSESDNESYSRDMGENEKVSDFENSIKSKTKVKRNNVKKNNAKFRGNKNVKDVNDQKTSKTSKNDIENTDEMESEDDESKINFKYDSGVPRNKMKSSSKDVSKKDNLSKSLMNTESYDHDSKTKVVSREDLNFNDGNSIKSVSVNEKSTVDASVLNVKSKKSPRVRNETNDNRSDDRLEVVKKKLKVKNNMDKNLVKERKRSSAESNHIQDDSLGTFIQQNKKQEINDSIEKLRKINKKQSESDESEKECVSNTRKGNVSNKECVNFINGNNSSKKKINKHQEDLGNDKNNSQIDIDDKNSCNNTPESLNNQEKENEAVQETTESVENDDNIDHRKTGNRKRSCSPRVLKSKSKIKKITPIKKKVMRKNVVKSVRQTVGGPRTRKQFKSSMVKKSRKNELDKLHEDINEVMGPQAMKWTGRRSCTLNKDDNVEPRKLDEKHELPHASSKVEEKNKLDIKSGDKWRVVIKKTDISELSKEYSRNNSDISEETDSLSENKEQSLGDIHDDSFVDVGLDSPDNEESLLSEKSKTNIGDSPDEKHRVKRKKRSYTWRTGFIKRTTKKKTKNSHNEGDNIKLQSSKIIKKGEELGENLYPADRDYFFGQSNKCKLCPFSGKLIIQHYRTCHSDNEVLISRMNPDNSLKAIQISIENDYESIQPFDTFDRNIKNRKQRFDYTCPFCGNVFLNEMSDSYFDHLAGHTGEYRFSCIYCPFKTCSGKNLRPHIKMTHKKSSENAVHAAWPAPPNFKHVFGYICSACHFVQLNRTTIDKHINKFHTEDVKSFKISLSLSVKEEPSISSDNLKAPSINEEQSTLASLIDVGEITNHGKTVENVICATDQGDGETARVTTTNNLKSLIENEAKISSSERLTEEKMLENKAIKNNKQTESKNLSEEDVINSINHQINQTLTCFNDINVNNKSDENERPMPILTPIIDIPSIKYNEETVNKILVSNTETQFNLTHIKAEPIEETETDQMLQNTLPQPNLNEIMQPMKSSDLNAFVCQIDMIIHEQSVEEKRLKRMKEIHEIIKPLRISIVDKLQSRLETTIQESIVPPSVLMNMHETLAPTLIETVVPSAPDPAVSPSEEQSPTSMFPPLPSLVNDNEPPPLVLLEKQSPRSEATTNYCSLPSGEPGIQKKLTPISNIINRLQDKLVDDSKLPSNKLAGGNCRDEQFDASGQSLKVGPISVTLIKGQLLYTCFVEKCLFSTDKKNIFETHCKVTHKDYFVFNNRGKCDVCNIKIDVEGDYLFMYDIFKHLFMCHNDFFVKHGISNEMVVSKQHDISSTTNVPNVICQVNILK